MSIKSLLPLSLAGCFWFQVNQVGDFIFVLAENDPRLISSPGSYTETNIDRAAIDSHCPPSDPPIPPPSESSPVWFQEQKRTPSNFIDFSLSLACLTISWAGRGSLGDRQLDRRRCCTKLMNLWMKNKPASFVRVPSQSLTQFSCLLAGEIDLFLCGGLISISINLPISQQQQYCN